MLFKFSFRIQYACVINYKWHFYYSFKCICKGWLEIKALPHTKIFIIPGSHESALISPAISVPVNISHVHTY